MGTLTGRTIRLWGNVTKCINPQRWAVADGDEIGKRKREKQDQRRWTCQESRGAERYLS